MKFNPFENLLSKAGLRRAFALVAILVIPICLALLWIGKRPGLTEARAFESALLARHLANGDGFVISAHRPLLIGSATNLTTAPDRTQPPAYPLLQSVAFRLADPSADTVAKLGLILWLITGWLLWLAARAWWNPWVATVALFFYLTGTGLIAAAGGGLPHPLLALCLLGIWWFGFGGPVNGPAPALPAWRVTLTGGLAGIAVLTEYRMFPLLLVLAAFYFFTQPRRSRAAIWFLAGSLALLAPWWTRNLIVAGGRPWGWFPYEMLTPPWTISQESVWLSTTAPTHPFVYFVLNPLELARRFLAGLLQLRAAGSWLDPVVIFLFATALFGADRESQRKHLASTTTVALACVVLPAGLFGADLRLLLAWWPLLTAVAAAQLVFWFRSQRSQRPLTRIAGLAVALSLSLLPLLPLVIRRASVADVSWQNAFTNLAARLPAEGIVVTDVPVQTAWYLNRPTLALPTAETDLDRFTHSNGIAAVFLTGPFTDVPDWWRWLIAERGVYHGLSVTPSLLPGRVRLPPPAGTPTRDAQVGQREAETKTSPLLPEAHLQLGWAYLRADRMREAEAAFMAARQLEPDHLAAQIGVWEVRARLEQTDRTLWWVQQAAKLPDGHPLAGPALKEASQLLEQLTQQTPWNPWLVLHWAACASRLEQDDIVAALLPAVSRQVTPAMPARLLVAESLAQEGQMTMAIKECRRFLVEQAGHPTGNLLLGRLLLAVNQPEPALAALTQAAAVRPEWGLPRLLAAEACNQLQRFDEAMTWANAAATIPATKFPAQSQLASIHAAAGRYVEAEKLYRAVLDQLPDQFMALNNLADVLVRQEKLAEAVTITEKLLRLYPDSPISLDTAGLVYYRTGKLDTAATHLQQAVRLAPRLAIAWFHLGQVRQAQGKNEDAASAFRRALDCGLPTTDQCLAEQALKQLPALRAQEPVIPDGARRQF